MEKDLKLSAMLAEFQKQHLTNALFWLTDYVVVFWLAMENDDTLSDETVVSFMVLGVAIFCIGKLIRKGKFRSQGRDLGLLLAIAPWVFNYLSGPAMFKVVVWVGVTFYREPEKIWVYLNYAICNAVDRNIESSKKMENGF